MAIKVEFMGIIATIKKLLGLKQTMINIILFGPPGSGKGTQAEKLVEKFCLVHISTGDLFRYEMGNDTPLGIKAKEYIKKGELVPDSVTIGMLKNKVTSHPEAKGFIYDGFPRTIPQAEALDQMLADNAQSIDGLFALTVDDDEIKKRILSRGETSGRADDLDEDIIQNRIEVYNTSTLEVYEYYNKQNKAVSIEGLGSIDEIANRLQSAVKTTL